MGFLDDIWGRKNTHKTYKSLFTRWIEPTVEVWFTEKDLEKTAEMWSKRGLSPRTVKSLIALSSKYINWLGGNNIDTKNLVTKVMRKRQDVPMLTLNKVELDKLKSGCEQTELHIPVSLATYTGMRKGEVFGLKWKDIDLLKGQIFVSRSFDGPTKNGKSRYIPISKKLEVILLAFLPLDSDNCIEDSVIPRCFDPNPPLKAMCKKVGIREITFHQLRHTFATMALESGRSPRMVQLTLGHSSLSTTLDLYWGLTSERMDMEFL